MHTHHLQRDLDVVDQVIVLPGVQRMSLLSHYKNNISSNRVWALEGKHKSVCCVVVGFHMIMWACWKRSAGVRWWSSSSHGMKSLLCLFCLPGANTSYSPESPDKLGCCHLTSDIQICFAMLLLLLRCWIGQRSVPFGGFCFFTWSPSLGKMTFVPSFHPGFTSIVRILSLILDANPSAFITCWKKGK